MQIGLDRADVCNADFLSALVYQALVPINCPHCNVPATQVLAPEKLQEYETLFGLDPQRIRCASDNGCPACQVPGLERPVDGHGGIAGMTVCAEVLPIEPSLLKLLKSGKDQEARSYWQSQRSGGFDDEDARGKEAWGHALYLVASGHLDPYHFEHCFGSPDLLARTRLLSRL
jgi:type II secretory ATPase GspE/PulE/Tfp pilus assembly ATPase PilB-like protein